MVKKQDLISEIMEMKPRDLNRIELAITLMTKKFAEQSKVTQ